MGGIRCLLYTMPGKIAFLGNLSTRADCSFGPSEPQSQIGSPCPAAHLWIQVGEKGSNFLGAMTGPVTIKGGWIVGSVDPHWQQVPSAVSSLHLWSQLRSHLVLKGGAMVGPGVPQLQLVPSVVWSLHLCSQSTLSMGLGGAGGAIVWSVPLHWQQVFTAVSALHRAVQSSSQAPLVFKNFCGRTTMLSFKNISGNLEPWVKATSEIRSRIFMLATCFNDF